MYHFLPDHPNQKYRRMNRSIWRSLCSPPQVSGAELEVCNTFWEDDFLYLSFIAKGAANCNVWTPLILQHPSKSAQKLAAFALYDLNFESPFSSRIRNWNKRSSICWCKFLQMFACTNIKVSLSTSETHPTLFGRGQMHSDKGKARQMPSSVRHDICQIFYTSIFSNI